MSELLDAALRLASTGRPVFPCTPRGKQPLTPNGLLDATIDRGTIERWWARWPSANVALLTGAQSRVVVLDVDGDDGAESLRDLEREQGALPSTTSVVTPRGGQHYYFKHSGCEVRNSAGLLGTGLDIRAEGGYVLAPPSAGANGRRYEADERVPIVPMPAWLLARVTERDSSARAPVPSSEWIAIFRDGLGEGKRNHGLARLSGHLLRRYVDVDLARELVLLANERCRPPLSVGEVERILDSIAGRELRRRSAR